MKKGEEQSKIKIIKDAFIDINKDKIFEIETGFQRRIRESHRYQSKLMTPGLVDLILIWSSLDREKTN